MPAGRRKVDPFQQLILRTVMVGFICLTLITLVKSCFSQRNAQQNAWVELKKKQIDKEKSDAEANVIRLKRERDIEARRSALAIEQQKAISAQQMARAAELKERERKEKDALLLFHKQVVANQPWLLKLDYNAQNEGGIIMRMHGDDRLIILRRPENSDTGKSDYEVRWSSGSLALQEVVNFDANGLPKISLVENRANNLSQAIGWSNFKIDYNTSKISGQYHYECGVNGLTLEKSDNGKLTIITKIENQYPGDKAGLECGDEIINIDGQTVAYEPVAEIESKLIRPPGSHVELVVFRTNPSYHNLTLVKSDKGDFGVLGLSVNKINREINGAMVTWVQSDGPAGKAGIHINDIIAKVDTISVGGMSQEEVEEHLMGPIGKIKHLGVCHFLSVNMFYDKKTDDIINVTAPIPKLVQASNNFTWPSATATISQTPAPRLPVASPNTSTQTVATQPNTASNQQDADIHQSRVRGLLRTYCRSLSENDYDPSICFAKNVYYYGAQKTRADIKQVYDILKREKPFRQFRFVDAKIELRGNGKFDAYVHIGVRLGADNASAPPESIGSYYVRVIMLSNEYFISHLSDTAIPEWQLASYKTWIGPQDIKRLDGTPFSSVAFESKEIEVREIIYQDRVNYSRGNGDARDEDSEYFHVDKLSAHLDKTRNLPVKIIGNPDRIIAGSVFVQVKIFKDTCIQVQVIE
jgi:hypothetical protein